MRALMIWGGVLGLGLVPLGLALASPLLQWRDPVYILSGVAAVGALWVLLLQPLLGLGAVPGLGDVRARGLHRIAGLCLVALVVVHVGGLWITSPPDVVDALLFRSPTPFSVYGVLAMWAVFATALLALFWRRVRIRPRVWRRLHVCLGLGISGGTVVHAVLIEGTMEPVSKVILCAAVLAVALWSVLRVWLR